MNLDLCNGPSDVLQEGERTRLDCAGGLGADVHDEINNVIVQLTIKAAGRRDEEAYTLSAPSMRK
jgi:hypothetical protein